MDGLRQQLLRVVTDIPGTNTRQAASLVGAHESSADYHLRSLAREGQLLSEFNGRTRHWYAAGCGLCPVLRKALPALRRDEARALAGALAEEEAPLTAAEAAARSGLGLGSVRWAASVLQGANLVARSANGRLVLQRGARTCLAKAQTGDRCSEWGTCPVSQAFLAKLA